MNSFAGPFIYGSEGWEWVNFFGVYIMPNYENRLRIKSCRLWGDLNIRRSLSQRQMSWLRLYSLHILMDPHSLSMFLLPSAVLPSSATVSSSSLCHDLLLYSVSINQLLWRISWSWSQVKSSHPKDPDVNHTIAGKQDFFLTRTWISFLFFLSNITLFFSISRSPWNIRSLLFIEGMIFHPFPVL